MLWNSVARLLKLWKEILCLFEPPNQIHSAKKMPTNPITPFQAHLNTLLFMKGDKLPRCLVSFSESSIALCTSSIASAFCFVLANCGLDALRYPLGGSAPPPFKTCCLESHWWRQQIKSIDGKVIFWYFRKFHPQRYPIDKQWVSNVLGKYTLKQVGDMRCLLSPLPPHTDHKSWKPFLECTLLLKFQFD